MNWFQRLWATPKFHAGLTVLGTIATAIAPPPWNLVAMTIAGYAGTNAAVLPHQNVTPLGGSMHANDYVNAGLSALGLPIAPVPARGALHAADYASIISGLTAAMSALPPEPVPAPAALPAGTPVLVVTPPAVPAAAPQPVTVPGRA